MKTQAGAVVAAVAASACCLGPVLLSLLGAGALGVAAARLEPLRSMLMALTGALLAAGFFATYRRPVGVECGPDGSCSPASTRKACIMLWVSTVVVILLITFPYYVDWLT